MAYGFRDNYEKAEVPDTGGDTHYEGSLTVDNDMSVGGSLNIAGKDIIDLVYPVGSIYMSTSNTSPATLFGGAWDRIQNRFLLSAGTSYTAGATGGSANAVIPYHRHSVAKVTSGITGGSHTHQPADADSKTQYFITSNLSNAFNARFAADASSAARRVDAPEASDSIFHHSARTKAATHTHDLPAHNTEYVGTSGNVTGANMPPYLVVYMWKRTA